MSLSIVLLAAGEGKRMKTNLPKPLVMLGSDPLVQHSLNTIKIMKPEKRQFWLLVSKKMRSKNMYFQTIQAILFFVNKKNG